MPDTPKPARLANTRDFAAAIRRAYPEFHSVTDDNALTHAVVKAYPQFKGHVIDVYEGADEASLPGLPDGTFSLPKSVPPPEVSEGGIIDDARLAAGGVKRIARAVAVPGGDSAWQGVKDIGQGLAGSVVRGSTRLAEGVQTLAKQQAQLPTEAGGVPLTPPPNLTLEEAAKPFADMLGGAMEMGELALAPAIIAAPWATAGALVVGTAAGEAAGMGARALGAPPSIEELSSQVAGLAAGAKVAHGITGRETARVAGRQELIDSAARTREQVQIAATREAEAARMDQANFQGAMRDTWESALSEVEAQQAAAQKAKEDLYARLALNQGLIALADQERAARARVLGPFDYLETAEQERLRVDAVRAAVEAGREVQTIDPSRMLPPSPREVPFTGVEPGTRSFSAEPPAIPPDYVGVQEPVPFRGTAEAPPAPPVRVGPLVDDITRTFEAQLTEPPEVREMRTRIETTRQVMQDMASQLEDNPHISGGLVDTGIVDDSGFTGRRYQGATPAASVYRMIVGDSNQHPPGVPLITDILRVFADTGAKSAEEIPKARHMDLRQRKGYGPREFLQAYDRWIPEVVKVRDRLAADKFAQRRRLEAFEETRGRLVGRPEGELQEPGAPPELAPLEEFAEAPVEPPAPVEDAMPAFLRDLEGDETALGGWEPDEAPTSTRPPAAADASNLTPEQPIAIGEEAGAPNSVQGGEDAGHLASAIELLRGDSKQAGEFRSRIMSKMPQGKAGNSTPFQLASILERSSASRYRQAAIDAAREMGEVRRTPMGETREPVEEQPLLPGAEAVRDVEHATPEFEAPFSLTGEAAAPAETPLTLWDALKEDAGRLLSEEEGSLRFTADPNNPAAVRRWLNQQAKEYGHEDWFDAATTALEDGDLPSAVRIISIASARSFRAEMVQVAGDQTKTQEQRATAVSEISDAVERTRAAYKKQIEAELGMALPKTVDVSPEGILTFQPGGKGVPALKARATDLLLARDLAGRLTEELDPTQIMRAGLSGDVPKQLQVSNQLADQIVRELPDDRVSDYAELLGFGDRPLAEQRIEIARQFRRAYSSAGRLLGELGRWTQENEEAFYDLVSRIETGEVGEKGSVGAMQAAGITTPEGFVHWFGQATLEQLAELKIQPPKSLGEWKTAKGELTPAAKTFARNWWKKQQRKHEVQLTINRLIEGEKGKTGLGGAIDRAVAGVTVDPKIAFSRSGFEPGRGTAITGLSKSVMLMRPGTAIRNTISQTGRYAAGMLDEALSMSLALSTGDKETARIHALNLKYLGEGLNREGTSSLSLFKHPWEEGLQATFDYTEASLAGLGPKDARRAISLLSEVPHHEARLMGALSLEGLATEPDLPVSKFKALATLQKGVDALTRPEVRNTATLFNRVVEHFFRSTVFDAMLRAQIEAKGLDPLEMLATPKALLEKVGAEEFDRMVGTATSSALDYTFASDPLPGTAPAMLLDIFQKIPVLSFALQMGMPFPRFAFVSAPRWIYDHTPLAPVGDFLLMGLSAMRSDTSPMFRGRFFQMLQRRNQQNALLDLDTQLGRSKYDAALSLSDFEAAREGQRQATKTLKAIEARGKSQGTLEGLAGDIERVKAEAAKQQEIAVQARAAWREQQVRQQFLEQQIERSKTTYQGLADVGAARSPHEYFARTMSGSMMMLAGYAMWKWKAEQSTTPGSPDLKWYEMPTGWLPERMQDMMGVRGQAIDLRSYSPLINHFFMPDFLGDIAENTDWSEFNQDMLGNLASMREYISTHYHGKYTSQKFMKDSLEAYASVSPAAGSTRDLLDLITGHQDMGQEFSFDEVANTLLAMGGQFIGRFFSGLTPISDIVGQFDEEERKVRMPEQGGEGSSALGLLTGPTLANIPFAKRLIPEKIDALTGRPVEAVDPVARQFGGVTKRIRNRVQMELEATGLPYSAAVPRQTGDREFDNKVNATYAKLLEEYFPQVIEDETYQNAPMDIRRDLLAYGRPGLSGVFPRLKKLAMQEVLNSLEDQEGAAEKLQSPRVREKRERWQKFIEAEEQRLAPQIEESRRSQEEEDAARDAADSPDPNAPPAFP